MEAEGSMRTEMMLKAKQSLGGDRDRGHRGPDKPNGEKPGSCKALEQPPCPSHHPSLVLWKQQRPGPAAPPALVWSRWD